MKNSGPCNECTFGAAWEIWVRLPHVYNSKYPHTSRTPCIHVVICLNFLGACVPMDMQGGNTAR